MFLLSTRPRFFLRLQKAKTRDASTSHYPYGTDMKRSWMIGDKDVDIKAANATIIQNTILVKSGHPIDLKNSKTEYVLDYIKQFKAVIRN